MITFYDLEKKFKKYIEAKQDFLDDRKIYETFATTPYVGDKFVIDGGKVRKVFIEYEPTPIDSIRKEFEYFYTVDNRLYWVEADDMFNKEEGAYAALRVRYMEQLKAITKKIEELPK